MIAFWEIVASNAVVAALLAMGVLVVGRIWKNAAGLHLLWLVVLLKLFTPPVIIAGLPIASGSGTSAARVGSPPKEPTPSVALEAGRAPSVVASQPRPEVRVAGRQGDLAEPLPSPDDPLPRSPYAFLAAVWALSSCVTALIYANSIRRFAVGLRAFEAAPPAIRETVAGLSARLGLSRAPGVLMTSLPLPPLVWSLGTAPRLILPSQLFARLGDEAKDTILAHELIHIRRGDHLVRLLEVAATTVFWWHPVAWLAGRRLRELEERCCDGRVLELLPHRPRTYAAALVETLEFLAGQARPAIPLRTAIDPTHALSRRIRMLSQDRVHHLRAPSLAIVAGLVALPLAVAFAVEQKPPIPVPPPSGAQATVLRGKVTNKEGVALPGARVRVAVPAAEMRYADTRTPHIELEAKADEKGDYVVELPGIDRRTKISIDAAMPGYRKLWGTLMMGGDARQIDVEPGATAQATLPLVPARYMRGLVVDEQGHPIPGAEVAVNFLFNPKFGNGSGGVERTVSGPDGSFELFNYAADRKDFGDEEGKGVIYSTHPDYIESKVDDVDAIEPGKRGSLRIVLPTGRKISGKVLDVAGKPVPDAMVEAVLKKGDFGPRKAALTGPDGGFALRGLHDGQMTLTATALDIKQKARLLMPLDADKGGLEVRLEAMILPADLKGRDVLGMKLVDVNPVLKAAYDLFQDRGALILDPGPDFERLKIGDLAEGYMFWIVGQQRVASVREFVDQLIAETGGLDAPIYSIRVVYTFKQVEFLGTNTQYMQLTKDDIAALKALSERLKAEGR